MAIELIYLLVACLIGLIHIGAQSFALKSAVGNEWTVGPRDAPVSISPLAGRLDRASRNFFESFALFAALVLACLVTDTSNGWSVWGGGLYLCGRILYLPAYAMGWPWVRTLIWQAATVGLVGVGIGLMVGA